MKFRVLWGLWLDKVNSVSKLHIGNETATMVEEDLVMCVLVGEGRDQTFHLGRVDP